MLSVERRCQGNGFMFRYLAFPISTGKSSHVRDRDRALGSVNELERIPDAQGGSGDVIGVVADR